MRYISLLFLIILTTTSHAQYESMLHKPFAEKIPHLIDFYGNVLKILDTPFAGQDSIIRSLKAFGEKHGDKSLIAEAGLATAWLQAVKSPENLLDDRGMRSFIDERQKAKDWVSAARAWRMLGDFYWQKNHDYETALECYFKNLEVGKDMSENLYPEKMYDYSSIGNIYYHFNEYKLALVYLRKALLYKPPYKLAVIQSDIRNTLGLCYQKMGNLDSSDYYFNQILQNETARHEEWKGVAMGNMGFNCFVRGDYVKAISLLEQEIAIANKYHTPESPNKSKIWLGNIYLKQNDLKKAEGYAKDAKKYIIEKNLYDQYVFLYPLLSKLAAAQGNYAQSQAWLDSALLAKDSVAKKFNAMQLARAEQKAESEKRQQRLERLEQEKASKTMQRNILIGFLIFLTVIAFYIYRLIQRRHKQEQLVKDLQIEKKETELSTAQHQLKDFTANFHEKARLLEQLESQLQSKGSEEKTDLLLQLQQSTLLTDDQWMSFRKVFDKVHGGYLIRLKEKLPDLTPAEIRYMALAKLRFNNKEMAAALGISQQTVRVTAHRLRKKLNMPEEGSLAELVDSV